VAAAVVMAVVAMAPVVVAMAAVMHGTTKLTQQGPMCPRPALHGGSDLCSHAVVADETYGPEGASHSRA
jgi:hypothetical protein